MTATMTTEQREGLRVGAVVTMLMLGCVGVAVHPRFAGATSSIVAAFLGMHAALSFAAWKWHARRGDRSIFKPKGGDVALGGGVALALYAVYWGLAHMMPAGMVMSWGLRLWVQVLPSDMSWHTTAAAVFAALAALDEFVWRGWVLHAFRKGFSDAAAVAWTVGLSALARTPALVLLVDPVYGPNPLPLVAVVVSGIVWSSLSIKLGRIAPAIASHVLLVWALFEWPLWG